MYGYLEIRKVLPVIPTKTSGNRVQPGRSSAITRPAYFRFERRLTASNPLEFVTWLAPLLR